MDVRGYIGENTASFFGALREWLAIPSISADPAHHADVRRSADWLIDAEIDLRGPDRDLHSGSFGGGVPNPLHALAGLLAGLHDRDGRVTLPGLYDQVKPIADPERNMFAKLPFDEASWLAEGGHTGPGGKTIIPAQAHAKLSFRLVAHQEPADVAAALREYVAQHTPPGIEATVTVDGPGVRPSFSPVDSPAVLAARRAPECAFGKEILFTREGGSGPEADLAAILRSPPVFLAVGLDSDRIHAPNEKVEMPLLLKGAEAAACLWDELAAGGLTAAR